MTDQKTSGEKLGAPFRSGFAAIVGRANVGKSTLANRLVGTKVAIVSPVAQTTRHRILGVRRTQNGQIAFIDGPGFHRPQHHLGQRMMETARQVAGEADVILFVIDGAAGIGPGDEFVREQLSAGGFRCPVILVPNKVDTMNKGKLLPMIERAVSDWGIADVVPVSALSGDNCDRLLEVVISMLPEGPALFPDDFVTDQDERRLVAEIVREKLLARLRQEVPHAIAVLVERMDERDDGLLEIHAAVLVERESQKSIVIGRGGQILKQAGTLARQELEQRAGRRVFLKLWVKVREEWRDRQAVLRDLGIY